MAIKKTTSKATVAVTEEAPAKHWFPAEAKTATAATTPAPAVVKKSPWQRRPVMVNYGTIAGPCYNMKTEFHKILDKKYNELTDEQRNALWSVVGTLMITEDRSKLSQIIEQEIIRSSSQK